jgi:hypothetical protein
MAMARALFPALDEFLRDPQVYVHVQRPQRPAVNWRRVMGFGDFRAVSKDELLARFKELSRKRHPDAGGTHEAMVELINARDVGLRECIDEAQWRAAQAASHRS